MGSDSQTEAQQELHSFLLHTAEVLHRNGTPSFRLEGVMQKLGQSLGVPSVFLYTPTALVVGLGEGEAEKTYVRRVDSGDINISRILELDATLEELESGGITLEQAASRIEQVASSPSPFPPHVSCLAAGLACGGVAILFGGLWRDVVTAAVLGLLIAILVPALSRISQRGLLEPLLGFGVALAALAIAQVLPINGQLVTLAALILPIPGLTLTVALTELAVGHLSSGSARLAGALVTLFTLVLGVAIAWQLCGAWADAVNPARGSLPVWCDWLAALATPVAFAIVLKAPIGQWPAIITVVVSGFAATRFASDSVGIVAGALLGAFVVGCGSNVYARLLNRPAMIPQTPGLLVLVPGSIGYRSLTAMIESDTLRGVELAFSMSIIGIALAGGLLLANQIISPRRVL